MTVPSITLNNGTKIPQVGFGLWKVHEADFRTAFLSAAEAGYRHFDTAQAYDNEQFLGALWEQTGVPRKELFITTKIAVQHFGAHHATSSFADSLQKLQMDYVDLLLLHFPVSVLRKKTWQAVEAIYATGQAKAIGVSNYTIRHLEALERYAKITPAVNQVELHIFLQQPELVAYCKAHNIAIEAYSPLAHARSMDNTVVLQLAEKHHKTYAQIMLRWCVQQGFIVLPKSVTPSRIQENIAIFDFTLDDEDMQALAAQNRNLRTCWDPTLVP